IDQPGTPASTRGSRWPGSSDMPTTSSGACARADGTCSPASAAAPPRAVSVINSRRVTRVRAFIAVRSGRSARPHGGRMQLATACLELVQVVEPPRAPALLDLLHL